MSGHTGWAADDGGEHGWLIFEVRHDWPTPPIAGNLTEDVARTIAHEHNSFSELLEAAKRVASNDYFSVDDEFEQLEAAIAKAEGRS